MSKWYPCVYCTEDLRCTKYDGDGVVSFCVLGPCHDETPSNADRIRSMTDEELAEFIGGIFTIERDPFGDYDPRTVVTQEPRVELRSIEDALDWLKQEDSGR